MCQQKKVKSVHHKVCFLLLTSHYLFLPCASHPRILEAARCSHLTDAGFTLLARVRQSFQKTKPNCNSTPSLPKDSQWFWGVQSACPVRVDQVVFLVFYQVEWRAQGAFPHCPRKLRWPRRRSWSSLDLTVTWSGGTTTRTSSLRYVPFPTAHPDPASWSLLQVGCAPPLFPFLPHLADVTIMEVPSGLLPGTRDLVGMVIHSLPPPLTFTCPHCAQAPRPMPSQSLFCG